MKRSNKLLIKYILQNSNEKTLTSVLPIIYNLGCDRQLEFYCFNIVQNF